MAAYFLTTIGQVVTLFIMMAVGFILAKMGKLGETTRSQMSFLMMAVVCPCLVIDVMQMERTAETMNALWQSMLVFGSVYLLLIFLVPLIYKKQPDKTRGVLRFGAIYGNVGFIGIPLIDMIYGAEGMLYCVPCLACFNIFLWTHGVALIGGKENAAFKKVATNPGLIGVVIGVVLFLANIPLPGPIKSAVGYIAGMNTPLSLILVGAQMAAVKIADTFKDRRILYTSAIKLFIVPALGAAILMPLKLDPMMYCATIMLLACPSGGNTAILAECYNGDIASGARLVTLSTLLSGITTPMWATIMLALTGG